MLDSRLVAIVRFRDGGDVDGAAAALLLGGVKVGEVTLDAHGAAHRRGSRINRGACGARGRRGNHEQEGSG